MAFGDAAAPRGRGTGLLWLSLAAAAWLVVAVRPPGHGPAARVTSLSVTWRPAPAAASGSLWPAGRSLGPPPTGAPALAFPPVPGSPGVRPPPSPLPRLAAATAGAVLGAVLHWLTRGNRKAPPDPEPMAMGAAAAAAEAPAQTPLSRARQQAKEAKGAAATPPAAPLGKKQVGPAALAWLRAGAASCAAEFLAAPRAGTADPPSAPSPFPVVGAMHRALRRAPVPPDAAEGCSQIERHVPTLWDAFQAAVRTRLREEHGQRWAEHAAWAEVRKLGKVMTDEWVDVVRAGGGGALVSRSQLNAAVALRLGPHVDRLTALLHRERDAELAECLEVAAAVASGDPSDRAAAEDKYAAAVVTGLTLRSHTTAGKQSTWILATTDTRSLANGPFPVGQAVGLVAVPAGGGPLSALVEGRVEGFPGGGLQLRLDRATGGDPNVIYRFSSARQVLALRSPDSVTHGRQLDALRRLAAVPMGGEGPHPAEAVVHALCPPYLDWNAPPPPPDDDDPGTAAAPTLTLVPSAGLDWAQSLALAASLDPTVPVVCIQGPPGSGKTGALIEIATRAVSRGQRVLCAAPSNAAVDNLVERLAATGTAVVRIGSAERIATAAQSFSLTTRLAERLEPQRPEWARRFRALQQKRLRAQQVVPQTDESRGAAGAATKAIHQLSVFIRRAERDAEEAILGEAQVVLATTAGAMDPVVDRAPVFDLVLLDESGQATEPASWIPLLRGRRAVLCGDPLQLPPLVRAPEAVAGGLGTSLLERALLLGDTYGERAPLGMRSVQSVFLDTQYRMTGVINDWASAATYAGQLVAAPAVRRRTLRDRPGVSAGPLIDAAMVLIDTRRPTGSLLWDCGEVAAGASLLNQGEAALVVRHAKALIAAGVKPEDIFALSPYCAQVGLIDTFLRSEGVTGVEVASVDAFQGREADAVILSMVRSNSTRTVGFLADARRINVAVTRARCHVAVVCDSATVGTDPFLRGLLEYIREHGRIASQ